MTQQDQNQKWSNNGGGCGGGGGGGGLGRSSSKKEKQKKVPQRGLGVAQLERMRIEEQQRKEAAAASSSKSFLPLQLPSFHHSNQPSSSPIILLHPVTPVDFVRLPHSLQNLDAAKPCPCTVPLENTGNFESTWPSNIQVHHGHENVHKLCNFEKDFVSSMSMDNLPCESNYSCPPSKWTQRTQQYHHQQPSSSMVNVSSGNLTSPAYHCSKEPPSNQNYSSSCVPMRPEEKTMKRSYPFSLNVPTASSLNFKSPAFTSNVKANESTSRAYGTDLNFGAASSSSAFREVPSCSTPSSSEPNSKKNENSNGYFLSLAPPISPPKSKSTSTFPAFHNQQELPHVGPPPFQGTEEDQNPHGQQPCLHSFFPEKEAESVKTREKNREDGNCNGEQGESDVDLNLKL